MDNMDSREDKKINVKTKVAEYLNGIKGNVLDMEFVRTIFNEVAKTDDKTTEINSELQKVSIKALEEALKLKNVSQEKVEDIINEIIENSKSARESKEKDDNRKDERMKMLNSWSKAGGVALLATVIIALTHAGIDVKDIKKIVS